MKLSNIKIRGYRSLYDVTWTPGDLNVVIGPNASGKSNLLRAMELLSVSAQGNLNKQVIREGGMGALVWDGQMDSIAYELELAVEAVDLTEFSKTLTYILEIQRIGKSTDYRVEKEVVDWLQGSFLYHPNPIILRQRTSAQVIEHNGSLRNLDDLSENETLLSELSSPFTSQALEARFRNQLAIWKFYQDFLTHRESSIRQAPIARHETIVTSDGSNLIQVLHTLYTENREFRHNLDKSMRAAFADDYEELSFPPAADQRIQMRLRWKSLKSGQSAADLSDGTLRFLYLIAILANPDPPSLIAIDEPETGLHPSMMPIIAEYAAEAALKTQVIITTHSAEFLNAFDHHPTTTVARWEDGRTILQTISGDDLRYWLKEYTLGKLYLTGELEGMA